VKRALDAVRAGSLGDIVAVDILRGAEYPTYEGGRLPPWYRSAGYAYRDLATPCMALFEELLGPIQTVEGEWRSLGGDPNLAYDEWRTHVRCERGRGQLQLTWNVKPTQSQLVIRGTRAVLRVDLFATFAGRRSSTPLPKAAERLLDAVSDSLRPLVDVFYRRLDAGIAPPVSAAEALAIVPFVEQIARAADVDHAKRLAAFPRAEKVQLVVTGASGSLGSAVVKRLVAEGKKVRVFVRRFPDQPIPGVEYRFGNLGDPDAVDDVIAGAETVIHVGASMKGGWSEHLGGTVVGTQNVIDACKKHHVRQLVHISSMSVIDWAGSSGKPVVSEAAALEPRADERGAYTRAKLEAERKVSAAAKDGLPCVILRPGQIFGGGIPLVNGAVARRAGARWLVLGDGSLELPLVYIDDVVDAVMASIEKGLTRGEVIQIIDGTTLTQSEVLALAGGSAPVLKVPRQVVFALGRLSELPLGALGRSSPIALYRLQSAMAKLHYRSDRAAQLLGWQPRVGVREGIRRATEAEVV